MEIRKELLKLKDENYALHTLKLSPLTKYKIIGIRIPILRSYAKKLLKEKNIYDITSNLKKEYFEEIMLFRFYNSI